MNKRTDLGGPFPVQMNTFHGFSWPVTTGVANGWEARDAVRP